MKSYKENWKKLIGIGVVALAALLVLIGKFGALDCDEPWDDIS